MCKNEKDVFLIISRFFYCSGFSIAFSSDVLANEIDDDCVYSGTVLSDVQSGEISSEEYVSREETGFYPIEENKRDEDCSSRAKIKAAVKNFDNRMGGWDTQFVTSSSESEGERMSDPTPINDESDLIEPLILVEFPYEENEMITTMDLIPGESEKEVLQDIRDVMNLLNERFNFGSPDLNPSQWDGNWVTFFRMLNQNITSEIKNVKNAFDMFTVQANDGAPNQYDGNFVKMVRFEVGKVINEIRGIRNEFVTFTNVQSDGRPNQYESPFYKAMRYEAGTIASAINSLKQEFTVFTNVMSDGSPSQYESPLYRAMRYEANDIESAVKQLKNEFAIFTNVNYDGTPNGYESSFYKVFRYETGRVVSAVSGLKGLQEIFTNVSSDGMPNSYESSFYKVFRYETGRVVSAVSGLKGQFETFTNVNSDGTPNQYESSFYKMFRYETGRVVGGLSEIKREFAIFTNLQDDGLPNHYESKFVKMIRYEVGRIVERLSIIVRQLEQFNVVNFDGEPNNFDGYFVQTIRYEVDRLIDVFEGLTFPSDGTGGGNGGIIPLLEEILDELKKFGDGFDGEAGTSIWDFLMNFTDNLFDMIEFLVEKIIYLVIPEDNTDILTGFEMLAESFKGKMEPAEVLKTELTSSMMVEEKDFESIRVSLPIYGEVMLFDPTYLLQAIPKIRSFLSGLMILITGAWAFRKINSGVLR